MPDDNTPSMHTGQATSGHRRTHRMNYGNKDIQLRMPSATAIRRFSQDKGNPTFDVPVSVSVKGGAPVQGWVRGMCVEFRVAVHGLLVRMHPPTPSRDRTVYARRRPRPRG
jgi:hypothetical protein